jgi:predicted TIM-barrel fold metal-dependent hydrolase
MVIPARFMPNTRRNGQFQMSEMIPGAATPDRSLTQLPLSSFAPRRSIRRPLTTIERPSVPAVDVHNHLGRWLSHDGTWMAPDLEDLLALMERRNISTIVNLDGRWGAELDENLARLDHAHPGKFVTFCHLDWSRLRGNNPTETLIDDLRRAKDQGARGLKVWKDLGLNITDDSGELVLPDDPRLTEVFIAAGELGLPILIHTADPVAFFEPLDRHNERLDELGEMPSWWFGSDQYPSFDRLMTALADVVRRAPGTTFIGAHVGCAAEDLDWVCALMDECQNFHADLGGRLGELGRQPRRFARLVERHPDRILFGTDCFPPEDDAIITYARFLETDDECFDYSPGADIPPQGRWDISGAALPSELLQQVYRDNAVRLLGL